SGKLVSPALLAKAYAPVKLPDGRSTNYGFGWELNTLGQHPTVEHGSGIQGFSSHELRIPDANFYVAVLCNTDAPPETLKKLTASLARLALGEVEPTTSPIPVPEQALQDYIGDYRVNATITLGILLDGGKLVGRLGGGQRPLTATASDEFSTPGNEMRLTFLRDSAHHVDRILVHGDGPGPGQFWPRIRQPSQ
ncbi:MAG TPA: hypothetical protein VGI75_11075, partial [Pirellulales bacterium]